MGLLDDAIREHLELKRRRGADPSELERQENEALGPARRGEFARPDGEAPSADAPPEEPAEPAAEEPAAGPASAAAEGPAAVQRPAPPRGPGPVQAPPVEEPPAPVEEPPPAGPEPRDESEPWLDEPDEVPVDDALEHSPAEPGPDARP